ncbi:hypothetical protein MNBD_GAMMA18-793 [hydrothermal vent metagenome]|uniref:Uncharacterized protein n=1 Tax=hydrothermal vent metagenome TaxID=652676 RepID=A0A3B0YU94_9ZZZZ
MHDVPKPVRNKKHRVYLPLAALLAVGAILSGVYFLFFSGPSQITEADVFNKRFARSLDSNIPLYRPAVSNWKELRSELTRLQIPYSALGLPKQLEGAPRQFKNNIFSLGFRTADTPVKEALFYRFMDKAKKDCAVLLIPGTGFDQATKISLGKGYHGKIVETIKPICDLFVLIKPNQGPLSIHNGKKSLDYRVVRVTLLNDGFSYSITYFVYAQAILQHLREQYQRIGVVGLSQGGEASLIIANLEQPDFAVVASGYSILNAEVEFKDLKQTIHPKFRRLNKPENVRQAIGQGKTKYFFSWGLREKSTYGFEASDEKTCKYFSDGAPEKVTCIFHGGKHVFPLNEVGAFIREQTKN